MLIRNHKFTEYELVEVDLFRLRICFVAFFILIFTQGPGQLTKVLSPEQLYCPRNPMLYLTYVMI